MRNTLITILGTTAVPCLMHVALPTWILRSTSDLIFPPMGWIEGLSILLAAIGLAMVIWVAAAFVWRGKGTAVPFLPPQEFVAVGLFRFVRNPMYVGLLLVILSEALYFRSVWLLLYAGIVWLAAHTYVVLIEEPRLARRFGAAYEGYLKTTPRWIPRPPRR